LKISQNQSQVHRTEPLEIFEPSLKSLETGAISVGLSWFNYSIPGQRFVLDDHFQYCLFYLKRCPSSDTCLATGFAMFDHCQCLPNTLFPQRITLSISEDSPILKMIELQSLFHGQNHVGTHL
jgi:hypothetical protein